MEEPIFESDAFRNHTVILGFGEFGQNIAKILKEHGEPYLAIENKILTVRKQQKLGEVVMFGNAAKKDILKKADVDKANKVIVAIDNPEKLYHICETLKDCMDSDKIIVKVHSSQEKEQIQHLGIKHIIVENRITSEHIIQLVL